MVRLARNTLFLTALERRIALYTTGVQIVVLYPAEDGAEGGVQRTGKGIICAWGKSAGASGCRVVPESSRSHCSLPGTICYQQYKSDQKPCRDRWETPCIPNSVPSQPPELRYLNVAKRVRSALIAVRADCRWN
jgi:hypothetical protein